ncbi:immunoglobulin domain-containing protein [Pedobacter mucosus]|uniref:immunoglobulin domain-containing protein n=1 Tax=Pedobacter mucosus TaxID=2895286 RepID=UPI001EE4E8FB|nr:Ig-like domain-containing protein [Pedobacter mucosus]UKT64452.1 Ig-like domain-containing protein [Pedobacter mucosus]
MPTFLYAQCENTARTYADYQGSLRTGLGLLGQPVLVIGEISDAAYAVNGQVKDASTLKVGVGLVGLASTTQYLQFTTNGTTPRSIAANTPVTVKISLPTEVLSVLSGVEIGSFTGLHNVAANWPIVIGAGNFAGQDATRVPIYTSANIAGVVSGAGEIEITLTPTQIYNGIYVKVSGNALSVALSAKLFHAYIMEITTNQINCDEVIDVLSGVQPTAVGGVLNASGNVSNPFNAIDTDQNSFSLMDVGTSVLNKIFLTAIFNKPSQPRDSVTIILGKPGGGLLDLNLLTGFVIQPYLNGVKAGPAFDNTNTFLNLRLFPGSSDKYSITFPITDVYDRLEITTGGLAGVLGSLRIYDIKRKLAKPRTLVDPTANDLRTICEGSTTIFSVQNPQACTEYKWYSAETGGLLLHTGLTFDPGQLPAGEYNYYVQSSRTYCITAVSDRSKVTLKVNPLPPLIVPSLIICSGSSATLAVSNAEENLYTYNWYSSSTSNVVLNVGSTYTTPILNASTVYYVEAINKLTGCVNLGGAKAVNVTVKPYAIVSPISGPNTICINAVETLSNTNTTGKWTSSNQAVATIDANNGKVIGIASGTTIISYTVLEDLTYCGKKVDFTLTVNPQPNLTLGPDPSICEGLLSTKLSYSNPVFEPITYSITWSSGPLSNVINQSLQPNEILINVPTNTPVAVYPGILTIKNAYGCERAINFNFRVKLIPHKPIVSIQ